MSTLSSNFKSRSRRLSIKVTRITLIIFNILYLVPASLLIYASFRFSSEIQHRDTLSQSNPILTYICVAGSALGLVLALISVLGIYGAIKRSKSILLTYALMMSILVLLYIVMLVYVYTISSQTQKKSFELLDKTYVNSSVSLYNYVDSSDLHTKTIDHIQKSFSCCGFNSPNDWLEYSFHKIPKSCCSEPVESSLPVYKYCPESDYKIGCWPPILDYLYEKTLPNVKEILHLQIWSHAAISLAAFGLMGMIGKEIDVV